MTPTQEVLPDDRGTVQPTKRLPGYVNWQLTYGCQLRCVHCYTESGRRAAKHLPGATMLRVAEILASHRFTSVQIAGGEPLIVPELFQVAARIRPSVTQLHLYTNGLALSPDNVRKLNEHFTHIHVSLDGAISSVHDRIRRGPSSFYAALSGLKRLDEEAAERTTRGEAVAQFGIDVSLIQSNFDQLELFCTEIAPRFKHLSFLNLTAAVPAGLANRPSFAEYELLTDSQLSLLRDPCTVERLRGLAPASLARLQVSDNFCLLMNPAHNSGKPEELDLVELEPDGGFRGLLIYEGTVGNVLEESFSVLYQRALSRYREPFVSETLSTVTTMTEWAAAARKIDDCFSSPETLIRLSKRQPYVRDAQASASS